MGISAARVVASTSVCAGGSFSVEGAASAANAETLSDTPYYGQVPSTENLGCALPSRVTSTVN